MKEFSLDSCVKCIIIFLFLDDYMHRLTNYSKLGKLHIEISQCYLNTINVQKYLQEFAIPCLNTNAGEVITILHDFECLDLSWCVR